LTRRGGRLGLVCQTALLGWAACHGLSPKPLRADEPPDTPRFAAHDHFDRLVVPLPPAATYEVHQDASAIRIAVPGLTGQLAAFAGQRLQQAQRTDGGLSVRIAPGTHAHVWQIDRRLIIDIDDAGRPADNGAAAPQEIASAEENQTRSPASAVSTPAAPSHASGLHVLKLRRLPKAPARVTLPIQLAPVQPVTVEPLPPPQVGPARASPEQDADADEADAKPSIDTEPLSGAIDVGSQTASPASVTVTLQPDATPLGPSILLPFPKDTGAAAFRRGNLGIAVFDTERSLDLGQLKSDPAFGGMTVRVLPGGIALSMPVADGAGFKLARAPDGWVLTLARQMPLQAPILAHADKGSVAFKAGLPGQVVVLDDTATGGKLLIGTQRVAGQDVPAPHESAEFVLLATWQGVAVEPRADRLSLVPLKDGFRLGAESGPKLSAVLGDDNGRVLTRRFDLPELPQDILRNRLSLAVRDAALTPKLSRFPARLKVAQAMLAEGLDTEARTVLHAATEDDPAHAGDPDAAALDAMAAFVEARAGGALPPPPQNFDPATLGDTDEGKLWRALLLGGKPDPSAEAASLAATWTLLDHYPEALRHRLLPAVGQILAKGGQDKALGELLQANADPALDVIRADWLHRQGKTDEALAWLDSAAKRSDRLLRAGALRDAVEMRLSAKKITEAQAADALARQLYAWRGGPSDLALRLRVADLQADTGRWRPALALLRESETLFPGSHPVIQASETKLVADLLKDGSAAKLGALDLVALAEEAAPLLTSADADATLAPVLVDKLLALDLPSRAEPILQRLFDQASTAEQKAQLGLRLASLKADLGDLKGALEALGDADDTTLPSELITKRALLRAKLLTRSGKDDAALKELSGLSNTDALNLSAQILEERGSWAEASKVLQAMIAGSDFAALPDETQRTAILRLANDENEAHDMAGLRELRSNQAARFASGPGAELFAVLTEDPVKGVDDLKRSGRELQAVRALPASLSTPTKNFP
jgi:hypothetical protein